MTISVLTRRYDADGGTSFSPPAHDDSFFYIRYPIGNDGGKRTPAAGQIQTLTEALSDVQVKGAAEATQALKITTATGEKSTATPIASAVKQQQFAKHTEPCKMFLTTSSESE